MGGLKWRFGVATLAIALTMTLIVAYVLMGRQSSEVLSEAETPARVAADALTYKSYLPIVFTRKDTIYGVEMLAVSDEDGNGLSRFQNAGTSWVHVAGISWAAIEPNEGQRDWSKMAFHEQNFTNAQSANMKVVVVVRDTPTWAQKIPPWQCGPITQTKMVAFGNFMYDLVKRYSVAPYNVKYWDLFNEPDVSRWWVNPNYWSLLGCWGEETDAYYGGGYYAEMLKAAYPRIKEADLTAQVLIGGLLMHCDNRLGINANYGCVDSNKLNQPKFLEGILRNGGGPYFDGVSFHAYDYWAKPGVTGTYSNTQWSSGSDKQGSAIFNKFGYIQSVLAQYGVTGKYILNTEVSLQCLWCTGDASTRARYEDTKAYLIAEIYPRAIISGFLNVMWFRNLDGGEFDQGMLNNDGTPRPVFTAYATSSAMLGGATFERNLTSADFGSVTGVRGYSFIREGKRIWTIWSIHNTTKVLTLSALPAAAYNHLGVLMTVEANRQLTLSAPGSMFTYVVWDQ